MEFIDNNDLNVSPSDIWMSVSQIGNFLQKHLSGKGAETTYYYRRTMRDLVNYCCSKWEIPVSNLDFATCHVIEINGKRIETEIRKDVVKNFLNSLTSEKYRKYAYSAMSAYFSYLLKNKFMKTYPVPPRNQRRPQAPKPGLTLKDLRNFCSVLHTRPIWDAAPIFVQLASGLRISEVCRLREDDIARDKSGDRVFIRREALKGKVAYSLPLPDIHEILDDYENWRKQFTNEFLFVLPDGRKICPQDINKVINEVALEARCSRKVTSHDMRRGFAKVLSIHLEDKELLYRFTRHSIKSKKIAWDYAGDPGPEEVARSILGLPCVKLAESFLKLHH